MWKLNVYQYLGLLTECAASFESFEGSSLSNPIEVRCCVTPKKYMYKEDVDTYIVYVWTKNLLCCLDVQVTRFLHVLLWLRTKGEVIGFQACILAKQDDEVCVITNQLSVGGGGRLNGMQHN